VLSLNYLESHQLSLRHLDLVRIHPMEKYSYFGHLDCGTSYFAVCKISVAACCDGGGRS